jgi:hypothetical protein
LHSAANVIHPGGHVALDEPRVPPSRSCDRSQHRWQFFHTRRKEATTMKITELSILSTALLAAVAAQDVRADANSDVPVSCRATAGTISSYRTGLRLGKNLVKSAWGNVRNCDRIDYFHEVLSDNVSRLTLPENPSASTVCRYTGTVDGVYRELEDQYGTCADECFLDGELAGQLSGEVYCELSIALGGLVEADDFLRGPVEVCGLSFEIGCDSAFIGTTVDYVNEYGACEPFTEDDFFGVWDQARNNQCAYDPIEPDPMPISSPIEPTRQ